MIPGFQKDIEKFWVMRTWNMNQLAWGGLNPNVSYYQMLCDHLIITPQCWTVLVASLQKDEHGNTWTNFEQYSLKEPVLPRHIQDALSEKLENLHKGRNEKHRVGAAWYAVPKADADLLADSVRIEEKFRSVGAFDRKQSPGKHVSKPSVGKAA